VKDKGSQTMFDSQRVTHLHSIFGVRPLVFYKMTSHLPRYESTVVMREPVDAYGDA
jgi:hypothetical protein